PLNTPLTSPHFPYPTLFRSNPEAQIRSATALLPNVVCVLGGVFPKPFDFNSEITEMLFVVAHHYNGYIFMLDTLFSPDMKTVCGDRKSTRLNSSHVKISYAV